MSANSGLQDNTQRIHLICDCGKKLVARATQSGKRLKCPSCGQAVVVPPVQAGVVPPPAEAASTNAASAPHPNRRKGRFTRVLLMLMLWSLPILGAVGGWKYLRFDANRRQEARFDAANTEVRKAIQAADGWVKLGRANEAEDVEQRLTKAMAAKDVSEKANADVVLERVRTRRAELAADSHFDAVKSKLDAKAIPEAVAQLNRYVADPHATKKAEAKQLLADCEVATSDKAALQTLVALSDEQFDRFRKSGKLEGRPIAHPNLVEMCITTMRRNVETANQRREENKLAEAKRQEADRRAVAGFPRLNDKSAVPTVWLHKVGNGEPNEITLYPNGKINDPIGPHSWTLSGRTVVLRWVDPKAPGGFWIDTCTVADDGKTYRGANQRNVPMTGTLCPPEHFAKQQINVLFLNSRRPGRDVDLAIDNLKALGPAAIPAAQFWVITAAAYSGGSTHVRQGAIEILSEIGGLQSMVAIGKIILEPNNPPEIVKALEDSLLKLLPAVGNGLKSDDAIMVLLDVHGLGNKRLSPAIENAWAASGAEVQNAVGKERSRRSRVAYAAANAKREQEAKAAAEAAEQKRWEADSIAMRKTILLLVEKGGVQGIDGIGRALLKCEDNPLRAGSLEIATLAEDALLKLLPTVGRKEALNEAIVLLDVYHRYILTPNYDRNRLILTAIARRWEACGFKEPLDVYLAAQQMTKEKLAGQGHYDKQGDYENRNIFLYPAPLFGDVPWGFQRWGLASMTALSTEVLAERIDPRDRRESFEERLQRERTAEIKAAQQRIRESTGRSPEEMRRGREEWEAREEADRKRREEEVQRDRMRTAIYNTQHMHDK